MGRGRGAEPDAGGCWDGGGRAEGCRGGVVARMAAGMRRSPGSAAGWVQAAPGKQVATRCTGLRERCSARCGRLQGSGAHQVQAAPQGSGICRAADRRRRVLARAVDRRPRVLARAGDVCRGAEARGCPPVGGSQEMGGGRAGAGAGPAGGARRAGGRGPRAGGPGRPPVPLVGAPVARQLPPARGPEGQVGARPRVIPRQLPQGVPSLGRERVRF